MEFIFICPKLNMTFESGDFKITENLGIINDSLGSKTFDAKIQLNAPCPFCGGKHVYHASKFCLIGHVPTRPWGESVMEDVKKFKLTKTVTGSG